MRKSEKEQRQRLGSEISTLMRGLVRDFRARFNSCADRLELGAGEAQLLWLIGEKGDVSTGGLADRLGVDPANASTLLTKLERRGLIRRKPAAHDRRRRVVSLSTGGRKRKEALAHCMEQGQPGFSTLSTSELSVFRDLLERVADRE